MVREGGTEGTRKRVSRGLWSRRGSTRCRTRTMVSAWHHKGVEPNTGLWSRRGSTRCRTRAMVSAWHHPRRDGEPMILRRPIPVNCIQLLRRLEEWGAGL